MIISSVVVEILIFFTFHPFFMADPLKMDLEKPCNLQFSLSALPILDFETFETKTLLANSLNLSPSKTYI